jgi:uncharacterized protein (DUF1684 family)
MTADLESVYPTPAQHEQEVLAWRRARVNRLTAPDSWLTLTNKHYLEPGPSTVGSDASCQVALPPGAPAQLGVLTLTGGAVHFAPAPGLTLALRDGASKTEHSLSEPVVLRSDASGEPDKVLAGSVSLEIMERAGSFAARIRDAQSPARTQFPGIEYFPIDPSWRVVARLERYEPEKPVELAYETGSNEVQYAPGAAVFERGGVTYRVDPVRDGPRPRLFLLFWDESCRTRSYGAGRFLYAPLPRGDKVVLDFNQAFSPPCAFTPFAACPLPPLQNRLALAVEAGEERPRELPSVAP